MELTLRKEIIAYWSVHRGAEVPGAWEGVVETGGAKARGTKSRLSSGDTDQMTVCVQSCVHTKDSSRASGKPGETEQGNKV